LSTAAVDEFEPRKACRRWKSVVASSRRRSTPYVSMGSTGMG
jgi:hypothetical protein